MPRPKVKINPLWGERLKTLCKEQEITQAQLAKEIFLSQQTISKIVKGHSSLTEETARRINEKYPQYPFEWLMGYSDYRTALELLVQTASQTQKEAELLMVGLRAFAKLSGYTIAFTSPASFDSQGKVHIEQYLKMIKDGYTISNKEKSATISPIDMNRLQNEICDFVEFKLKRICEKGTDIQL